MLSFDAFKHCLLEPLLKSLFSHILCRNIKVLVLMFPDRAEVLLNDADAEIRVRKSLAPLARHRPDPYEVLEIKMIRDKQEEFERQFSTNVFVQRNSIELISQMSNFSVGECKNQAIQSAVTLAM